MCFFSFVPRVVPMPCPNWQQQIAGDWCHRQDVQVLHVHGVHLWVVHGGDSVCFSLFFAHDSLSQFDLGRWTLRACQACQKIQTDFPGLRCTETRIASKKHLRLGISAKEYARVVTDVQISMSHHVSSNNLFCSYSKKYLYIYIYIFHFLFKPRFYFFLL